MSQATPGAGSQSSSILQLVMAAPVVIVTIVTAALFALSWGAYSAFYREYGVTPRELGMDYVTVLTQQAFPVAFLMIVILVVAAPLLLTIRNIRHYRARVMSRIDQQIYEVFPARRPSPEDREEAEAQRAAELARLDAETDRMVSRRAVTSGAIAVLLVVLWTALLFVQAYAASPGPYLPPLAVAPLQAQVYEVIPRWLDSDGRVAEPLSISDVSDERISGDPQFLLLGRTSETVILYESTSDTVIRLPSDLVALT